MCGIAGIVAEAAATPADEADVARMLEALRHRAPDGSHTYRAGRTVLGHGRLAIIDLVTGDQPVFNEDGTVAVVLNGEIYNYVELRRDLEARGHRFSTRSDTEVIAHLWEDRGERFVDALRGMFAIALHDLRSDTLVLVRDRLGKKPVHFAELPARFAFASELKALLVLPEMPRTPDPEAVDDYFTWQYVPAPRTIFAAARKLAAGHMLIRKNGAHRIVEYWDAPLATAASGDGEAILDGLEDEIREAVRLRLRSDVPLGAFLSGGIDSNLVVAHAAKLAEGPLRTTTIAFRGADSEAGLAALTARRYGTDHEVIAVDAEAAAVFERVTAILDEPLGDSSTIPTWIVSREARRRVTVALSGDGGDEGFGGYAWRYWQNQALDRVRRRLPTALRRGLFGGLARAWPKGDRWPKPLRLKWGLQNLAVSAEEAYGLDMSILRPDLKRRLYTPDFARRLSGRYAFESMRTWFRRAEGRDLLARLMYVDLKTYLADGVNAKVDRMSMAHALEVRAPLLDHRVIEAGARIPADLRMEGRTGKIPLRRLAARVVDPEVVNAAKAGFAPPIASWLRRELRPLVEDLVAGPLDGLAPWLRPESVRRIAAEHMSGRRDHARPLWLFLVFETWFRRFGR